MNPWWMGLRLTWSDLLLPPFHAVRAWWRRQGGAGHDTKILEEALGLPILAYCLALPEEDVQLIRSGELGVSVESGRRLHQLRVMVRELRGCNRHHLHKIMITHNPGLSHNPGLGGTPLEHFHRGLGSDVLRHLDHLNQAA